MFQFQRNSFKAPTDSPINISRLFSRRLLFLISLTLLVTTAITTVLNKRISTHFLHTLSKNNGTFIADQLSTMIGELEDPSVWQYDADKLSEVLSRAMRVQGVMAIQICDGGKDVIAEKKIGSRREFGQLISDEVPITFSGETVGWVRVFIDLPKVRRPFIFMMSIFAAVLILIGIILYVFPVKVVKGLEAEINQSYGQLSKAKANVERIVEERTSELKEALQKVQQSQKQLVQSEKMSAVGQLAAGIAHEINNPIGIIMGFAQGAVQRIKPGDPLEIPLKSIEREAVRCKDLVQNLLTFSRADQGDHAPLDLNKMVEAAFSLVSANGKLNSIEIKTSLSPDLPHFLGNANQIQQILINLCNNAVDAMKKGGTLTIETQLLKELPQTWVCLKVLDTGDGIPPEIQSKIFEPFFTTKPVGKGTGLGLSLVYEMVKKHSALIEVQSRPGSTAFSIKFPVQIG